MRAKARRCKEHLKWFVVCDVLTSFRPVPGVVVASIHSDLHCAEEMLQFLEGFLGTFFLEKMAAIETAPSNR